MINKKSKILILLLLSMLLYSCQTTKDALQGKKRSEQSDEFLVEKKNPLALPPDFDKLPLPGEKENSLKVEKNNSDIKNIINLEQIKNTENNSSENTGIEEVLLKKIK